jgi:hypothetical protein
MIKEWYYNLYKKLIFLIHRFTSLSIDERVLTLTSIDKIVTDSIIRMQKKLSKHGNGKFSLETRIIPMRQLATKHVSSATNTSTSSNEHQQQP